MTRPPVRDDLAELAGYHSPQVDVEVRLNTNEAPEPPPSGFAEAVAKGAKPLINPAQFPADTGNTAYLAPQILVGVALEDGLIGDRDE